MRLFPLFILIFITTSCFLCGCTSNLQRPPNDKEIKYFKEISLGSEYGGAGPVTKWPNKMVFIKIHGEPDESASNCLNSVIKDFNEISNTTQLKITNNETGDMDFHFKPFSEFPQIEPRYKQGNKGFFTWNNTTDCRIYYGRVLIDTQSIDPTFRCHLIREELTQSLGFGNDAKKESPYKDSAFYDDSGESTTRYSDIDRKLIQMMYSTDIPFCATSEGVDAFFN